MSDSQTTSGTCPAEHGGKMPDCAAYPACACDYPSSQTIMPTWVSVDDMPAKLRGWYWAKFPGSWVFYSPEMNATRDIDQGNAGWHPLISSLYWGPWTQETLDALQLEAEVHDD